MICTPPQVTPTMVIDASAAGREGVSALLELIGVWGLRVYEPVPVIVVKT